MGTPVNSNYNKTLKLTKEEKNQERKHQKEFDKKYKDAVLKSRRREERRIISQLKRGQTDNDRAPLTMTKLILLFIIANCTLVEIFSMIVIWRFREVSVLETLISAVVAESFSFLIYCVKSYFETKAEKNNDLEYYRIDNTLNDDVSNDDISEDEDEDSA